MTDYVTLIIDETILTNLGYFALFFLVMCVIIMFIDIIEKTIESYRKEKRQLRNKPYRDKYDKLLAEKKYEEALAFRKNYGNYLDEGEYYS